MNKNSEVEPVNQHDLEIDEKLKSHLLGWKVQTAGLVFIFAVVLSAGMGLYGNGVASRKTVSAGLNTIEYERFGRFENMMPLKVKIAPTENRNSEIALSDLYLRKFRIETIMPQPSEVKIQKEQIQYVFESKGSFTVTMYLIPQEFGQVEGSLFVNNDSIAINQFIFP